MFAIEDNSGGILVNINNLNKTGIWNGIDILNRNNFNISSYEIDGILAFIIRKGLKKLIDDETQVGINMISNLENTYFYIRRDDKHTRRYYMRKGYNCSEYDIKKGRTNKYYLMGVIVVRHNLNKIKKNSADIIDWIEAYYEKTNTSVYMINILEKHFGITLIPSNINPAPKYWKKYLFKKYDINSFENFITFLWNSSYSIDNYYYILYDIEAYYKIYDEIGGKENMYLRLLYDY